MIKKSLKTWEKPSIKSTLPLKQTLSSTNQGISDGGTANTKRS